MAARCSSPLALGRMVVVRAPPGRTHTSRHTPAPVAAPAPAPARPTLDGPLSELFDTSSAARRLRSAASYCDNNVKL